MALVLNNRGWQAIRDLQWIAFGNGTDYATMFEQRGQPITPHIADAAKAFGAHAVRITGPDEVVPALEQALAAERPAVVEVMIGMELGTSGGLAPGWWDVPVPYYFEEQRPAYEQGRVEERI